MCTDETTVIGSYSQYATDVWLKDITRLVNPYSVHEAEQIQLIRDSSCKLQVASDIVPAAQYQAVSAALPSSV